MAVDTRDKRFSLLGFGQARFPIVLPNPDGTVGDFDRYQFAYMYAGLAVSGFTPPVANSGEYLLRRRRG